jgi:hypothetical protein
MAWRERVAVLTVISKELSVTDVKSLFSGSITVRQWPARVVLSP